MNLSVTVNGQDRFQQALDALRGLAGNLQPAWPSVADAFYRIEVDQFAAEGRGPSGRWKPLTAAYLQRKEANYGDLPIGYRTGAMKQGLLGAGPNAIKIETPTSLTLGTSANRNGFYYPVAMQQGMRKMPARPPIDLTPADFQKITARLLAYFQTGIQSTGFTPVKSAFTAILPS